MQTKKKEKSKRKVPTTVRTAGSENVKETDMGTRISKSELNADRSVQKKRLKKQKKVPSTVRTAGYNDALATDD